MHVQSLLLGWGCGALVQGKYKLKYIPSTPCNQPKKDSVPKFEPCRCSIFANAKFQKVLLSLFCSEIELPGRAKEIAAAKNFALAGYKIDAAEEQLRASRVVRIGAIQNQIILPTDAPIAEQVKILLKV